MHMRRLLLFCIVLYIYISVCNSANNAFFIKTTTPYSIDGNASDWAQNTATHPITDTHYQVLGDFKAGYDNDHLYFLVTVTDGSPLANAASITNFQQSIYTGAGVSICFGSFNGQGTNQRIVLTRGDDMTNLLFVMRPVWDDSTTHPYSYYTTASGNYVVDYEWFLEQEGAQVAFGDIQGGWVAEVLIPWSVLQYSATDGDYIPFDIEILVPGSSGNTLQAAGWWFSKGPATATEDIVAQAKLYPSYWGQALMSPSNVGPQPSILPPVDPAFSPRGIPISFSIPVSDNVGVTVNVIDADTEWVYRELVRAKLMTKGDYTVYWDGFDREGKIVPAGKYRVIVAYFPPLNTTYAGSVGNSGVPPYPTSDGMGSLGGVHYGPCAVASDSSGVYQMNTVEEGFGGLRKINPYTGAPIWVASIGMFAYSSTLAVEDDIICTTSVSESTPVSLLCFNATSGISANSLASLDCPANLTHNASGMAILNSTVYISIPGSILIATPTEKKSVWTQTNVTIDGLISICRFNSTHLILIANSTLWQYEVATGLIGVFITNVEGALVCTTQGDNGDILVSNSIQVTKYNYNGEVLLTIGTAGGRPLAVSNYSPYQLQNVLYLAVGPDDNIYMAEREVAPYRFAVFSADNGTWIRDYYGPIGYETVVVDRDNVSNVYFLKSGAYPWLIQTSVDYNAYEKDPTDSHHGFSVSAIHLLTQNGIDTSVVPDIINNNTWGKVNDGYGGGNKYMFLSGYRRSSCLLFTWDDSNLYWKPRVAYNSVPLTTSQFLIWLDVNNNGLVDSDEYFPADPIVTHFTFYDIDSDLNLYSQRYKLSPSSIDSSGLPRYDTGSVFDFLYSSDSLNWNDYFSSWNHDSFPSSTPSTSENASYAALSFGPAGDTAFWDRSSVARIVKFANGTAQWIIGHKDASLSMNGDAMMLEVFAGEVDGIGCVGEIISNFHCFTSDGISLGWLLTDGGGNMASVGYNTIDIENAGEASFIADPVSGQPMIFSLTTGDLRILNVVGPFGNTIVRNYQEVTLTNPLPRLTGTVPQERVYNLQYLTQGTGSDGYFYYSLPYTDAWDWEWINEVPALTINGNNGDVISEVRLRRDAGELDVFADVLGGTYPYFPENSSSTFNNLASLFGTIAGVEVLIGPTPSSRTSAEQGDTRIFLTAAVTSEGQYIGYAYACRPTSPPVNATFMRTQDIYGNYTGHPNFTETIDFTNLVIIPGALVAVLPRTDKKGYRLEASIPLSLLAEITEIQPINFRRFNHGIPTGSVSAMYTDNRPDINNGVLPLSLNIAIYYQNDNNTADRFPWVADGFSGTNPTIMNPSLWGVIESPATILYTKSSVSFSFLTNLNRFYTVDTSNVTFEYAATSTVSVDYHHVPSLSASSNALAGGVWFGPTSTAPTLAPVFVSPSPAPGFSVQYISGMDTFVNYIGQFMRFIPLFDASPWGFSYPLDSAGGCHPNTSSSIFFEVTTGFPEGISGTMHILWGDFTENTYTGCYLNITDERGNTTISGLSPEYEQSLSIPRAYNAGGQTRDTSIIVGGSTTITVSLTNPKSGNLGSYIQAIWIEPLPPTTYTSPANITLLCQVVRTNLIIDTISFYNQNILIGKSTPNTPIVWYNVNAGQYQLVAVGTDKYTGQSNSTLLSVNVYGPVVTLASPLNASTVPNPVTIDLSVTENGPNGNISAVSVSLSSGQRFKLVDAPWSIDAGNLPEGNIEVTITAVDTNGYYSNFQYSFGVTSAVSIKKKMTING